MNTTGDRAGGGRATRADARSNRARILEAAERVFGTGGAQASTEEVARLAGVGIATVFRHFPTKASLLDEVLSERFATLAGRAARLRADPDPGAAFFDFFAHLVEDAAGKRAIGQALAAETGEVSDRLARAAGELRTAVAHLLDRAQRAGAVRRDVGLDEVYALLVALSAATAEGRMDDRVREAALGVVFDGLAVQRSGRAGPGSSSSTTSARTTRDRPGAGGSPA